jgi:hypothetical protein
MKKKVLSLTAVLLMLSVPVVAQVLDPISNMKNVKFVSESSPVIHNNVTFYPFAPLGGINRDVKGSANSDSYGNDFATLSTTGIILSIVNNSNSPINISWKDSTINIDGKQLGTPFLEGMRYADAGNPSATPPTIVGAGQKANVFVFTPNVRFINGSWNNNGYPLKPSKNIVTTIYAMVNGQIVTITTPGINLIK